VVSCFSLSSLFSKFQTFPGKDTLMAWSVTYSICSSSSRMGGDHRPVLLPPFGKRGSVVGRDPRLWQFPRFQLLERPSALAVPQLLPCVCCQQWDFMSLTHTPVFVGIAILCPCPVQKKGKEIFPCSDSKEAELFPPGAIFLNLFLLKCLS